MDAYSIAYGYLHTAQKPVRYSYRVLRVLLRIDGGLLFTTDDYALTPIRPNQQTQAENLPYSFIAICNKHPWKCIHIDHRLRKQSK